MTLSETIRDAIEKSGQSRYAISQATGVSEATLSRFSRGLIELRLDTADILCQHLHLELRPTKRGRIKKGA